MINNTIVTLPSFPNFLHKEELITLVAIHVVIYPTKVRGVLITDFFLITDCYAGQSKWMSVGRKDYCSGPGQIMIFHGIRINLHWR